MTGNWLNRLRLPGPETALAWQLALAAAVVFLPASVTAFAPTTEGWETILLVVLATGLVFLTGLSGSYLWLVVGAAIVVIPVMVESDGEATDILRLAVVGSSLLIAMECIRLSHVARRAGRISDAVYRKVVLNVGVVIASMTVVSVGAAALASSRTFPGWLIVTALALGGVLTLLWGRSVSTNAKRASSEHGSVP